MFLLKKKTVYVFGTNDIIPLFPPVSVSLSLSDRRVEFGGCEADCGRSGEGLFSSKDSQ